MPEPVVVTAVFTPRKGAFDDLVHALSVAIAEVHEEDGCLLYAIHSNPQGQIIMIEKWSSVASLDKHGSSPAVERLNKNTTDLLAGPVVVTRLVPIQAGTPDQGRL